MVRVVHSLFAETDDWDDQLTGVESGWPSFFRILRLYLEHFAGQPSSQIQLLAMPAGLGRMGEARGRPESRGGSAGRAARCGRRRPSIERHRGVSQCCRASTHAVTRRSARSGCGVCHRVPRRRESIRHSELLSLRRHRGGRRGARPVRLDCVDDESLPGVNEYHDDCYRTFRRVSPVPKKDAPSTQLFTAWKKLLDPRSLWITRENGRVA